jgi:hypothetical protein
VSFFGHDLVADAASADVVEAYALLLGEGSQHLVQLRRLNGLRGNLMVQNYHYLFVVPDFSDANALERFNSQRTR